MTKKVGASYERKKSDGNYGSIGVSAWVEQDIPDDKDGVPVINKMHEALKNIVEAKLDEELNKSQVDPTHKGY